MDGCDGLEELETPCSSTATPASELTSCVSSVSSASSDRVSRVVAQLSRLKLNFDGAVEPVQATASTDDMAMTPVSQTPKPSYEEVKGSDLASPPRDLTNFQKVALLLKKVRDDRLAQNPAQPNASLPNEPEKGKQSPTHNKFVLPPFAPCLIGRL